MGWRIEVKHKDGVFDALGESAHKSIVELGLDQVSEVSIAHVYHLEGKLTKSQAERIASDLLTDKVTQNHTLVLSESYKPHSKEDGQTVVEIAYNLGVMDPVEASTLKGVYDLGIKSVESLRTSKKYFLKGNLSPKDLNLIVDKVLANKLIQHEVKDVAASVQRGVSIEKKSVELIIVDLINASDKELMSLSSKGQLFLNLTEMQTIQKFFKKIKRNPIDCELETIAQTWSEHCYHKTFRGNIRYTETEKGKTQTKVIKSLLKSTIVKATTELNKPWCVSVFHDNAGVIKFDDESNVCFKVETHNHPSALEPFGGANTGIGGVIRDILGTGLGARPICSTDVFCFAPPDMPFSDLPPGTLHPKRVMKGVVSGVRDYGNKMGIPTINGAILFDKHFVGNPLVYCGNVGIMPKDKVFKKVLKGDLVVVVGGRTGRDGIHGATFSSGELTTESETVSSGAVQIGNPIEEKKVCDGLMKARDLGLYTAITDCGAGGLSSAIGEMGSELGARVDLDKVPLKYQGLKYMEIWISESQERMVLSVNAKKVDKLLKVFEDENVEAVVIGEFTGNGRLELFYHDFQVCDLEMSFLHEGNPKITKEAVWEEPKLKNPKVSKTKNLTQNLINALSHYNVCSKEWVIRQYDHEVQGTSVIKPLSGVNCDGPSDASVIAPKLGSKKGIAVSNGINVRYGMIDPYWMAVSCIDEAVRQIVGVGGDPKRIAILDNFCWGNPDKPDRLGGLVRAALGCYKAAVEYGVPFISGKDSLYNEYTEGKKSIAIPGTLLISAIGIVDDVSKCVTMDFKEPGNLIYCIGATHDELGGSIYYDTLGYLGKDVPKINFKKANQTFDLMAQAVNKELIRSTHDCSEGGLAVSLAEMAFSGGLGCSVHLSRALYTGKGGDDSILFSESNSRFIVEIEPKNQKTFESLLKGCDYRHIGMVTDSSEMIVYGKNDTDVVIHADINTLKKEWKAPLNW